ncbi:MULTISPECIES: hypothetical protein [Exiguobacterium]|uniref:Uncharacterized protein n=2 Tax=Exiguobacterium TaxID=33986 RepID=C4L197_EXISA|nr:MULTISPECIES: hypothetical protein [Exiguobacterium]ACQ69043.1 hypothetical protein EAT1b_0109 [Exiguobacterium sp. AT1b]MDX5981987.1 hypothetical protein [Exiguobacterium profundum]WED54043.1 hypothetical protein OE059_08240 [Exiguobacterium profundum]
MKAQEILREIEKIYYWDARVLGFDCRYFGDEVLLIIEEENENYHHQIEFLGCIKVDISAPLDDRIVPVRELSRLQLPYFMHDVSITSYVLEETEVFVCNLIFPPASAEIHFTKIRIGKEYH